ncbi:MAG: phosphoribosylglycinamide formyltransferase [SAR324 cluster bacterium]|nr:phosphoribosylglycinamide formyltransferase [SAR324 cluster bacterium]
MSSPLPVGILVSGSGTNLQAIIDQQESGDLPIDIKIVISNVEAVLALQRAQRHGIDTRYISHKSFASRLAFDIELTRVLEKYRVELVVLAGFMRLLSSDFVAHWKHRLINVHPSILPAFPGLHAQRQAIDYGAKLSGCSVFFVDEGMDTGSSIIQAAVPVLSDDTEESLSERILREEHRILPQAIRWIAEGAIRIEGRRIYTPENNSEVN